MPREDRQVALADRQVPLADRQRPLADRQWARLETRSLLRSRQRLARDWQVLARTRRSVGTTTAFIDPGRQLHTFRGCQMIRISTLQFVVRRSLSSSGCQIDGKDCQSVVGTV